MTDYKSYNPPPPPKMRNYIKNKDNGYSFDKKNVMKEIETYI